MNFLKKQFAIYPPGIPLYTAIIGFQICRNTIFSSRQSLGAETLSGSVVLLILCILLNFYVVYRERTNLVYGIQGTKLFLFYIIFGIFSLFWSSVPNALYSIPKCLEVLSSYLMIAVVLWKIRDKNNSIFYLVQLCTIASILGYIPGLLNGQIVQHSSFFPLTGAMGFLLALGIKKFYHNKYLKYYMYINFAIMVLGTSSATYIALLFGLLIYMSSNKKGISIFKLLLTTILFLFVYWLVKDQIYDIIFIGKDNKAIHTASGRDYIWNYALEAWRKNPLFGQGFIVAERNLHLISGCVVQVLSTHNGYLSVLLGTGIIGSLIFGIFYINTFFLNIKYSRDKIIAKQMIVLFPALVILTINNLSIHAIGGAWDISMPSVLALLILIHTIKYKD